jgi:iron complex outermembrane receptor protein
MKTKYMISCAAAAVLSGWSLVAAADPAQTPVATAPVATAAADASVTAVEEVVVTANRRSESVQKVPMTVQAFSGDTLRKLDITTLDDLLKYTPNVTFASNGPGQGSIFMRGLSAGFAGNQSSATIGNFPNVAIYLDDQSMQFPARNVDIYMVDMSRVEVLEGPQGTLFGGGAEAGALRYITNKPKYNVFEGNAEAAYGFTSGGGTNNSVNATINVPIIQDRLAIRAVVYNDEQGGYITNEPSTFTRSNQDNGNYYFGISPSKTTGLCPNNAAAGPEGCTVAGAQQINNANLAKSSSNPTTYTGARLSIAAQINPDWDVLIAQSFSNLNAEGLSSDEPIGSDFQTLKPLEVTSFEPSYDKDNWENTAWTLNGKVGPLKLIYTGGYMDRHISQQMDYTNYSRTGGGIYYECVGGQGGLLGASSTPSCYSPLGYWHDQVENTHLSNEVRVSSPDDWRLRFIAGAYEEQFRIKDVMNFDYKTIPNCDTTNLNAALAGGPICVANVRTAPGSTANDPGVRGDNVGFGEDTQRGYDQTALFGSVDFDIIPHVLTVTGGTRYFDYHETEVGSQYGTNGSCVNVSDGGCTGGMVNINSHNDNVTYTGFKSRASITWHPNANTTLYYLFSQGFRPGGFSRSQKNVIEDASGAAQYREPNGYAPDSLTNNEWGVKTELFERRLLLNVSAYDMDWTNVQYLIFNPTEGINTTFGTNGPSYNIKGIEIQAVGKVMEGLTIQGSGTYDDDAQSNSPCLVDNISGTAAFGKCITQVKLSNGTVQAFANPFGSIGSAPAFSPKFQGNIRGRYEWSYGGYNAHVQVAGNYVDSMYNEPATYPSGAGVAIPTTTILRYYQPAYATMDASIGVAKDTWTAELYATNLFDSHASTFTSAGQFIKTELPLRPTVIMFKIGDRF